MKSSILTKENTLTLTNGEKSLMNIPKNILYSKITPRLKVWINPDNPDNPLELEPAPIAKPGDYYFEIDFKTSILRYQDERHDTDCIGVTFLLQNIDTEDECFYMEEYISISCSTPTISSPAIFLSELFDLPMINDFENECSGLATLDYIVRGDIELPPFPILANFLIDN
ncbi:MAG: hypothetical protein PWP62_2391 [Eubacteriaceae bacterium]|nr:hypothetical protein [Eubacteriaceae bacterium]MDK2961215.1 hypothetical protein [Eubacteriaceae bacterium]